MEPAVVQCTYSIWCQKYTHFQSYLVMVFKKKLQPLFCEILKSQLVGHYKIDWLRSKDDI